MVGANNQKGIKNVVNFFVYYSILKDTTFLQIVSVGNSYWF